jgi:hypothetical protein
VVSSDGVRDGSILFAIRLIQFHVIYTNMIYASSLAALVAANCRWNDGKAWRNNFQPCIEVSRGTSHLSRADAGIPV